MPNYLDLKRRFIERNKYDPDELLASEITGKRLDWTQVLANRFVVIVAPANFGKTTEMRERAGQMRASGSAAFFVALRKVAERNSFEKALESEDAAVFREWTEAPTVPLTVFVDSLDEATAGKREGIGYLLAQVVAALQWPNQHVRWVISSRPAVLTPDVLAQLSEVLKTTWEVASVSGSSVSETMDDDAALGHAVASAAAVAPERTKLFSLAPLGSKQAELYLDYRHRASNASDLLRIARERGLSGLVSSPGGLDILANIDLVARPPECLTEVFQRVVDAVRQLQSLDERIQDGQAGARINQSRCVQACRSQPSVPAAEY